MGAELGGSGLKGHTLLGQTGDVYGGLLVEARLVVQQRDVTAERQRLASCRSHLEDRKEKTRKDNYSSYFLIAVRKSSRHILF